MQGEIRDPRYTEMSKNKCQTLPEAVSGEVKVGYEKKILTQRRVKHWNRISREVREPSLSELRKYLLLGT